MQLCENAAMPLQDGYIWTGEYVRSPLGERSASDPQEG